MGSIERRKVPPLALRVALAALESGYRAELRHFVLTLAVLANTRTGVGWHSQQTIAKAMGVTDRQIRNLEAELQEVGGPVRVIRGDRRGPRPSEWRLELNPDAKDRNGGSAQDPPEDRNPRSALSDERPERRDQMTGTGSTKDRNPRSDDLDQRSTEEIYGCASQSSAAPLTLTPSPSEKAPKSKKPKTENGEAHARVTAAYFAAFEQARGVKPTFDGADGTAVKRLLEKCNGDADRACAVIAGAFADDWTAQRTSIRKIASDPGSYLGARPKTNGRRVEVQGGASEVARLAERNAELRRLQGGPSLEDG